MRRNDHDVTDTLLRRLGHMLGTADIIAQIADRCYLEKCRDRLYPEFVLGGLASRKLAGGRTLPSTLNDGVEPYPKDLVIR